MKTKNLLLTLTMVLSVTLISAQHDFDSQGILFGNNGNIGIGTTTPETKLHLEGSGEPLSRALLVENGGATFRASDEGAVSLNASGSSPSITLTGPDRTTYFISNSPNSNGLSIGTNFGRVKLTKEGTLYIGEQALQYQDEDNNPDFRLLVEKGIRAERVKVDLKSNWPDYVFVTGYNLMPLQKLEAFIQRNNHLPDVPTAQEVSQEGIDLGVMDATLLRKIEELTLHLIEQNKRIQLLESQLKADQ